MKQETATHLIKDFTCTYSVLFQMSIVWLQRLLKGFRVLKMIKNVLFFVVVFVVGKWLSRCCGVNNDDDVVIIAMLSWTFLPWS